MAQIANTTPARIRLAVRGDEAAFTRARSTSSCAISALSLSSPHGGGTRSLLLVEWFIAQAGVIRLPFKSGSRVRNELILDDLAVTHPYLDHCLGRQVVHRLETDSVAITALESECVTR